jgi:HEAT repeats
MCRFLTRFPGRGWHIGCMGRKRQILLVVLAVAMIGGLVWGLLRQPSEPPEPVYQGKKLSVWLDGYWIEGHGLQEEVAPMEQAKRVADEAVLQIGTNAVPTLLRMLNVTDSPLRKLAYWTDEHDCYHHKFATESALAQNMRAAMAFRALGADAKGAVPKLIVMYNRNQREGSQELAALALGGIGPPASNAVPSLLRVLTNAGLSGVPYNSFRALGEIHSEPEKVIPVLVNYLKNPDVNVRRRAVQGLQAFGADARQAVPALTAALLDIDGYTRKAATNALKQIDPVAASKAGAK